MNLGNNLTGTLRTAHGTIDDADFDLALVDIYLFI